MHINSRSLNRNLDKIKDYLCTFDKFNVIAMSETWLDNDKVYGVELEGYEMFTINRIDKKGGEVAIYVHTALKCSMVKCMVTTVENIMECVTKEIEVEQSKNIIISCVYRTPGTCLDTFNEKIAGMNKQQQQKAINCVGISTLIC